MNSSKRRGSGETSERSPSTFGWSSSSLVDSHRLIAIYQLLGGDDRLLKFIFDLRSPKLRLPPEALFAEAAGLSHGERLLVQAGIDLWCGQGRLNFAEALETWDEENTTRFIRAVCHLAEVRTPVLHALIDDENCDGIPL
jgi:hypothetical protein